MSISACAKSSAAMLLSARGREFAHFQVDAFRQDATYSVVVGVALRVIRPPSLEGFARVGHAEVKELRLGRPSERFLRRLQAHHLTLEKSAGHPGHPPPLYRTLVEQHYNQG
jgi:hypothetical protein